jgi:hypothetical protein
MIDELRSEQRLIDKAIEALTTLSRLRQGKPKRKKKMTLF